MDELTMLIAGAIIMGLMQVGKRLGLNQKDMTLALAVVLGVSYFLYTKYVPGVTQTEIAAFVTGSIGFAKVVYDLITVLLSQKK